MQNTMKHKIQSNTKYSKNKIQRKQKSGQRENTPENTAQYKIHLMQNTISAEFYNSP